MQGAGHDAFDGSKWSPGSHNGVLPMEASHPGCCCEWYERGDW